MPVPSLKEIALAEARRVFAKQGFHEIATAQLDPALPGAGVWYMRYIQGDIRKTHIHWEPTEGPARRPIELHSTRVMDLVGDAEWSRQKDGTYTVRLDAHNYSHFWMMVEGIPATFPKDWRGYAKGKAPRPHYPAEPPTRTQPEWLRLIWNQPAPPPRVLESLRTEWSAWITSRRTLRIDDAARLDGQYYELALETPLPPDINPREVIQGRLDALTHGLPTPGILLDEYEERTLHVLTRRRVEESTILYDR